jgi:phosphoglycolate phosphatase
MSFHKLVLFDLDGTLVDSAPDIAGALNAALVELGHAPHPLPVVTSYVGDGAAKLVERAAGPTGEVDQALLLERFKAQYAANICLQTRPYPGIVDVLAAYRASGTPVAVVTNKPGGLARTLLRALALDTAFTTILGDGDGFPRKPDPAIALHACTRHGVSPADTLFVGDGIPDLQIARAANIPVAAALWGYTPLPALKAEKPTWLVTEPGELLSLSLA